MISLGNALSSVKDDEKWIKKIAIGGLISILALLGYCLSDSHSMSIGLRVVWFILYLISGAFISGFIITTAQNQINNDSNTWAEWSEPKLFFKGIKYILSYFVYIFTITIIFMLIGTILTLAVSLVLGLIYYLINLALNLNPQFVSTLAFIIFTILMIFVGLYLMQFLNAALISYYKNHKFHDIMALKKHFKMISENQHTAWTLVGKEILYGLLFLLIYIVLSITVIGVIAIPFVYFTSFIVITNLYAQYAKEIEIGKYID